jgi:hypothetical protein
MKKHLAIRLAPDESVVPLAWNSSAQEERHRLYDDLERGRKLVWREHGDLFPELREQPWSREALEKLLLWILAMAEGDGSIAKKGPPRLLGRLLSAGR